MKDQWADWAAAAVPGVHHYTRKWANYKTPERKKKGRRGKPSNVANARWVISEIVLDAESSQLQADLLSGETFPACGSYSRLISSQISAYILHLTLLNTPLTLHPPHHLQEAHSWPVPANQPSGSLAEVMGVGAGVWCKHEAADKQIMLSLCCHGWQHTQRGASALPGRRVHPFSQGGGEGEHEVG